MRSIRKRLTYANVMSSIAVFLMLGGATALAATQLAKNSVGTKQLKKNAVTTAKIKNGAVTTNKIKNGAVTGAKVNLSTLGKVPNAVNADTVAGNTIQKFFYASNATTARTTILSLDGLTLTASCPAGKTTLVATSAAPSLIRAGGTYLGPSAFYVEDDTFEPGEEFDVLEEEHDSVQGTFTYAQPSGTVVTGTFAAEEEAFGGSSEVACLVSGHAIG